MARRSYYKNDSLQKFDIVAECLDLTHGYYVTGLEESDYIQFKHDSNIDLDNYEIYEKIGSNNFNRLYTINQLINRNDTYVRVDNVYNLKSFEEVEEVNVSCYKYNKDTLDNFVFDSKVMGKILYQENKYQLQIESQLIDLAVNSTDSDFHVSLDDLSNAEF